MAKKLHTTATRAAAPSDIDRYDTINEIDALLDCARGILDVLAEGHDQIHNPTPLTSGEVRSLYGADLLIANAMEKLSALR